jgi:hypothetical protein
MRLLLRRSDAAPRRCDDLVMSGRDDESFEKKVRAIAAELSRSVERAVKSVDLDEIARQIEMGGERVRELADLTGRGSATDSAIPKLRTRHTRGTWNLKRLQGRCPSLVRIRLMFPATNRGVRSARLIRVAGRLSREPTNWSPEATGRVRPIQAAWSASCALVTGSQLTARSRWSDAKR